MPVWTHSRLESSENCPLFYHWAYKQRKPGYTVASGAGRIGNTVHAALEQAIGVPGTLMDTVLERQIMAHQLTKLEELEALTFKGKIESFVERFNKFCARHSVPRENFWVEKSLAITAQFKSTPYKDRQSAYLRGILDLCALVPRKDTGPVLFVWDHKTGAPSDIEKRRNQFYAYALLGMAQWPDISEVRCAIHHVKTGDIEWFPERFKPAEIVEKIRPSFLERVGAALEVEAMTDPAPVVGWKCDYCKYAPICPARGGSEG